MKSAEFPSAAFEGRLVLTARGPLPPKAWPVTAAWARNAGLALGDRRPTGRRSAEAASERPAGNALDVLRSSLAGLEVDANWIPAVGRGKRLLLSDMDSTAVTVECFDELAIRAGRGDAIRELTRRAMDGEMPFEESYRARLAVCRGVPVAEFEWVWRQRVRLSRGAETLVRSMAARGGRTVLVTGGFAFFAERVARQAGFAAFHANDVGIENGRMTGEPKGPVLDGDSKLHLLERERRRLDIPRSAVTAVGDGANDKAMLAAAGLGVAWRARPEVKAAADAVLDHSGLDAMLALQGIDEGDFWRADGARAGFSGAAAP